MKDKVVFISHSSKDKEIADRICNIFEDGGLGCWIAPRDIPYGNVWTEEIVSAIEASKVMLFIFSENSNDSMEVIKEINLALKNSVTIIPIHTTDIEYNKTLKYFLSLYQHYRIDDNNSDDSITVLRDRISLYLNGSAEIKDPDALTDGFFDEVEFIGVNIDDELDAKFYEIFEVNKNSDDKKKNVTGDIRQKLRDKICQNILSRMFGNPDAPDANDDLENQTSEKSDAMSKYFSITEKGTSTLCYMVRRVFIEPSFSVEYITEQLDCAIEKLENGEHKITYFADDCDSAGHPIILITFPDDPNFVMVNMGFLDNDTVMVSKKPETVALSTISRGDGELKRFRANENGTAIVIDPDTCEAIERKRHYDRVAGKWIYYMEVISNKSYFSWKIQNSNPDGKASAYDIGYGYYKGRYGLKQNVIEAVYWFDKAATPKAYECLCDIFKNDPLLADEEFYSIYSRLAKEAEE